MMSCTFRGYKVKSTQWLKKVFDYGNSEEKPVEETSPYHDHFQYLGNKWNNCTMRIDDVQKADAGEYRFSFQISYSTSTYTYRSKTAYLWITGNEKVVEFEY